MGILSGEIVEIYVEDGRTMGKVRIGAATVHVAMTLLMSAQVGNTVLVDSGIALSKLEDEPVTAGG